LVPVQGGAGAEQQQQQQEEVVMAGQGTWSTASWQTPGQDEAGVCFAPFHGHEKGRCLQ
jgi:hypothetical protein